MARPVTKISDEERKFFGDAAADAAQAVLAVKPEIEYEKNEKPVSRETIEPIEDEKPEPVAVEEKKEEQSAGEPTSEPVEVVTGETKPKMVPHAALHEAREEEKRAKAEAAELRKLLEEARKSQPAPVAQPQPQQETVIPDADIDPVGFLKHVAKQQQSFQQQQQQKEQFQNFTSTVVNQETQFRRENPDYDNALQYVGQQRARELMELGVPQQQIQQQITRETMELANFALSQGKNPAQVAYQLAQTRGYQKPQPVAAAPEPEAEVETINRMANTQRAARSLSSNAATPIKGKTTGEDVMRMSPQEIVEFSKRDPEAFRKLAGA